MSRQNYYRQRCVRERLSVDESLVLELVHRERARQPRLGGRKLLRLVRGDLIAADVHIGRDRFFELLERHALLIERQVAATRTTHSAHGYRSYDNLAKTLEIYGPDQLLLADITYLRTLEGFMYLGLLSDAFSRAIVGFDCSDSLEMEGALRALRMALRQLPAGAEVMHHSDRGCQYCCGAYTQLLISRGITISMTQQNHCAENSQAERLNGILKQEYSLGQTFASKSQVPAAVAEAVYLFNHFRPHTSLAYRMPMQVHRPDAA